MCCNRITSNRPEFVVDEVSIGWLLIIHHPLIDLPPLWPFELFMFAVLVLLVVVSPCHSTRDTTGRIPVPPLPSSFLPSTICLYLPPHHLLRAASLTATHTTRVSVAPVVYVCGTALFCHGYSDDLPFTLPAPCSTICCMPNQSRHSLRPIQSVQLISSSRHQFPDDSYHHTY